MDLIPYAKEIGAPAAVLFLALYLLEIRRHDATRKNLNEILPLMAAAMAKFQTSLDLITDIFVRDGVQRREPTRRD